MRRYILITIVTAGIKLPAQTILSGELRPRVEYRHGYKSLIDTVSSGTLFIEQRTRLNLNHSSEKLKVGISLHDIRVWGSQSQLIKNDVLLSLHEAWGEYYFTSGLSAQFGRQHLIYDDERILGGANWVQQGRSHDLLRLKFADSTFTAHAGLAYNQNTETTTGTAYTVINSYKILEFLWLHHSFNRFNLSFLILHNGIQSPTSVNSVRYSQTIGSYLEYKKGKTFVAFRGYYQTGKDGGTGDRLSAYNTGIDISYDLDSHFTLGFGAEILSGQSQTDTTQSYQDIQHAFNPLHGTGHKFNGHMDYFYVGNHINSVGLRDFYCKTKYSSDKFSIGLDVHHFMSASDVLDASLFNQEGRYVSLPSSLGTEIDLTATLGLTSAVSVQVGYAQMFANETMESLKGGSKDEANNWTYLMITLKPQFFKSQSVTN